MPFAKDFLLQKFLFGKTFAVCVLSIGGDSYAKWEKRFKPGWWPEQVNFGNPSGKEAHTKETCDLVIDSFVQHGHACFDEPASEEALLGEQGFLEEEALEDEANETVRQLEESVRTILLFIWSNFWYHINCDNLSVQWQFLIFSSNMFC